MIVQSQKAASDLVVGDLVYHAENGWEPVTKAALFGGAVRVWTTSDHDGEPDFVENPYGQVAVGLPSYRTYGVEQVAFDAVPPYCEGGPAKTVADGYSISYGSLDRVFSSLSVVAADDGKVTLSAHHVVPGAPGTGGAHPLNDTKYATDRDAERAAYEAGLLHFWVPARDVERFEAKYLTSAKQEV